MKKVIKGMLSVLAASIPVSGSLTVTQADAATFPSKPIELVCTTKPGSGTSVWCEMLSKELAKDQYLGVPINVTYKSGGSNHEPVLYVTNKDADGYTIMHMSRSFTSYFNLPHFTKTFDDFSLIAQFEQTVYGVGVRCDDPDIKSWDDLVAYNKANPGELAMGSNKVGSTHHLQHVRIGLDPNGADLRFVPYRGTGGVVKDVIGKHLRVGFAQPGLWNPHIEAGTICPLLILNEERLDHPLWADVPSVRDVGMTYEVPHQWQGFMVKAGTSAEHMDKLAGALRAVAESDEYKNVYMANNPHVVPAFEDNRDELATKFRAQLANTREFLLEIGMIEN